MIIEFLHDIFTVIKFFFGLGALLGLIAIGALFLWYALRIIVGVALRGQPPDRYVPLRKLFLEF